MCCFMKTFSFYSSDFFIYSTGLAGISLGVDCDIEHEVTVVNHNHFMI